MIIYLDFKIEWMTFWKIKSRILRYLFANSIYLLVIYF